MTIWNRQQERDKLWNMYFARGKNVAQVGQRRTGKTYLMRLLEKEAADKGYNAIFINLETEISTEGAIAMLLIDELSVCLLAIVEKDKHQANEFLHTLRALREEYPHIRWLITGSIGLHAIEKNYGLDGNNDLHIFHLAPLTPTQATALLQHECQNRKLPELDANSAAHFIQRLGWLSPRYLLHLLDALEELYHDSGATDIDKALIDAACNRLTSYPYNRAFTNWSSHIDRNYPDPAHKQAKVILKALCKSSAGKSIDGLLSDSLTADISENGLRKTLNLLEEDGFIVFDSDLKKYDFQFGLLKDYWREYEGF